MLVFGHISAHRDVHLNQDGLTLMSSGHHKHLQQFISVSVS